MKKVTRKKPAVCVSIPSKSRKGHKGRWTCISKKTGRVIKVKGWGRARKTIRRRRKA